MYVIMWLHTRVDTCPPRGGSYEMDMRSASLSALGRDTDQTPLGSGGSGGGAGGTGRLPMASPGWKSADDPLPRRSASDNIQGQAGQATETDTDTGRGNSTPRAGLPWQSDHVGQLESGQRVHLKSDVYSFGWVWVWVWCGLGCWW